MMVNEAIFEEELEEETFSSRCDLSGRNRRTRRKKGFAKQKKRASITKSVMGEVEVPYYKFEHQFNKGKADRVYRSRYGEIYRNEKREKAKEKELSLYQNHSERMEVEA